MSTSVADRQRDRTERGLRSRLSASGESRPSPPRRRRPGMAALAVLLVVGGAALAGLLALRLDSREPVIVLATDVPAGTEITADLLRTTPVAGDDTLLVPEDQVADVLGTYARVTLSRGQLLDTSMLTRDQPIGAGAVRVGAPLTSGRVPPDLRSGDQVRLVRLGDGSTPPTPLAEGLVMTTSTPTSGDIADDSGSAGVTLLVSEDAADGVIDAGGNDVLGIALIERGVPVDQASLAVLGPGGGPEGGSATGGGGDS